MKKIIFISLGTTLLIYFSFFGVILYLHNKTDPIDLVTLGVLGDSFGVLTSLFTALAFIGLIATILLQQKTINDQIMMFKRKHLFDFHYLWDDIEAINSREFDETDIPDLIKVVNNLSLTALIWNSEIIDRNIIIQSFSQLFVYHYRSLDNDRIIPVLNKQFREYLTPEITKAFNEINKETVKSGKNLTVI